MSAVPKFGFNPSFLTTGGHFKLVIESVYQFVVVVVVVIVLGFLMLCTIIVLFAVILTVLPSVHVGVQLALPHRQQFQE